MAKRKSSQNDLAKLTEVFRAAGAPDPEDWARSQLEEGIPQLALFSLAKSMWAGVVDENDLGYVEAEVNRSRAYPKDPCSQAGKALEEMLSKGISRSSIIDLIRVVQYETLYHVTAVLDGARTLDVPVTEWLVFQVDEKERPVARLHGIHEILLGLDPTGREMRPRPEK